MHDQIRALREMLSAQTEHSASPEDKSAVSRSTSVWLTGAGIGVEVPEVGAEVDAEGGTKGVAEACRWAAVEFESAASNLARRVFPRPAWWPDRSPFACFAVPLPRDAPLPRPPRALPREFRPPRLDDADPFAESSLAVCCCCSTAASAAGAAAPPRPRPRPRDRPRPRERPPRAPRVAAGALDSADPPAEGAGAACGASMRNELMDKVQNGAEATQSSTRSGLCSQQSKVARVESSRPGPRSTTT